MIAIDAMSKWIHECGKENIYEPSPNNMNNYVIFFNWADTNVTYMRLQCIIHVAFW